MAPEASTPFCRRRVSSFTPFGNLLRIFPIPLKYLLTQITRLEIYSLSQGIKLDDLNHVKNFLEQDDWMTVNDLDSGYWHVPLHKDR